MLTHPVPRPRVVIVGGGLAGLAAAVSLSGRDVQVTLIESRPRLGGRAGSFTDPLTGALVDNCQHVSMSCCTNLADFCKRVGTLDLFKTVDSIRFLSPSGKISTLAAGRLPAPLHLSGSFLRANYLTIGERLRVAYGLARLILDTTQASAEPFADWLLRHRQTIRTINLYWGTVLISALNERLERMDFTQARKVFVDGFLRNREGYRIELPTVPLGELYGLRLERWLKDAGVEVRLTTGAKSVELDSEGAVQGVTLRNGDSIAADFVVLATPFDRITGLLGENVVSKIPDLTHLQTIESSPITGIHLWYDREVCPFDHVVTVGRTIQWVFNHSKFQENADPKPKGDYLQVVVSASYDLLHLDKNEILQVVTSELAEIWPKVREAKLERWWVVTEHGATFAVRPGIDAIRPPQRTPIDGLFLAGDWTDTGWPATMEGAVRSGYKAAEGVLRDLDRPTRLIQRDLPTGPLASLLLGPGV